MKPNSLFSVLKNMRLQAKASAPSIPVFAVYKAPGGKVSGDPIYYACTRTEALSHISRLVQINHADHYSAWCRLHNMQPGFPSASWNEYATTIIGEELTDSDSYAVAEAWFSARDMATFMRMLSNSTPGFIPAETNEELIAYISASGQAGEDYIKKACLADPNITTRIESLTKEIDSIKK